ncbi:hypothetical protein [Streptomyces sp. NPDC046197]|uniref:hypothetical protein n=1 Tax=Streptomyces sp. NPDC046197 TaxID=3154337 RepID=UPI0033E7F583
MAKSLSDNDITVVRPEGMLSPAHDPSRGRYDDNDRNDAGFQDHHRTTGPWDDMD